MRVWVWVWVWQEPVGEPAGVGERRRAGQLAGAAVAGRVPPAPPASARAAGPHPSTLPVSIHLVPLTYIIGKMFVTGQ